MLKNSEKKSKQNACSTDRKRVYKLQEDIEKVEVNIFYDLETVRIVGVSGFWKKVTDSRDNGERTRKTNTKNNRTNLSKMWWTITICSTYEGGIPGSW